VVTNVPLQRVSTPSDSLWGGNDRWNNGEGVNQSVTRGRRGMVADGDRSDAPPPTPRGSIGDRSDAPPPTPRGSIESPGESRTQANCLHLPDREHATTSQPLSPLFVISRCLSPCYRPSVCLSTSVRLSMSVSPRLSVCVPRAIEDYIGLCEQPKA